MSARVSNEEIMQLEQNWQLDNQEALHARDDLPLPYECKLALDLRDARAERDTAERRGWEAGMRFAQILIEHQACDDSILSGYEPDAQLIYRESCWDSIDAIVAAIEKGPAL